MFDLVTEHSGKNRKASMENSVKLYALPYSNVKTYWLAALFVTGNIVLPQLCHLLPQGGAVWLPIYFFTLVGSYKYGWKVGLLTAALSPLLNSLLFGMPPVAVLPVVLFKSVALAVMAGFSAARFHKATLATIAFAVLGSQFVGILFEWMLLKDMYMALQDFRIGFPGILMQIFGGYLLINHLIKK